MSTRRVDRTYFPILAVAAIAGYVLSNVFGGSDELPSRVDLPELEQPDLELEVPFEFPYQPIEFKARALPRMRITGDLEAVLSEVRRVLLKSAAPSRVDQPTARVEERLASSSS